jgi:hypothetical protein
MKYENFLPLTSDVGNFIKLANRKGRNDRPEIESHSMGARIYVVYQISRGCDK